MSARVRAWAVVLCVFGAGVLTGIVIERHRAAPASVTLSAEREHAAAMAELRALLELDDQQVAQIEAILSERQEIVDQMWEQLRPEVQAEMRNVHMEIAETLRPEQIARFHEWLVERGAAHQRRAVAPHER